MKKLGIAGGMGPYATALFYEKLIRLTEASCDGEHIECIIYSTPAIPDRSAYFTVPGAQSPLPMLTDICRRLAQETDLIAIPCMSSHHFYDDIAASVSVPVLDMHRICAEDAGVSMLGVMASEGTVISGRLQKMLHEHGITPILPIDQDIITKLIYDVKAGKPLRRDLFSCAANELEGRGAQAVLLGCTELQAYVKTAQPETVNAASGLPPLLDACQLLAKRCITAAGAKVRESEFIA